MLGYIGTLDRVKGVHLLLAALPRLASLGFSLRLAGDGRLREEVAAAGQAHAGLRWDGHLTGEAKRRFLEDCDVGLIPSVWAEPGGPTFTMVEWLAARRPVLVSDRGGLGEVAGMYPGSEAVAPDVNAIVQAVAALRDTRRWRELAEPPRAIRLSRRPRHGRLRMKRFTAASSPSSFRAAIPSRIAAVCAEAASHVCSRARSAEARRRSERSAECQSTRRSIHRSGSSERICWSGSMASSAAAPTSVARKGVPRAIASRSGKPYPS